jgi:hypothetical protein
VRPVSPGCRGGAAFPGEGVAVPAVQGEAAAQFLFFTGVFVLVPAGAGFGAWSVMGFGVFVEASSERVVGEVDGEARIPEMHQAVKEVPPQFAVGAIGKPLGLVAAFVVVVMGAGVFAQQVVHEFVACGFRVE